MISASLYEGVRPRQTSTGDTGWKTVLSTGLIILAIATGCVSSNRSSRLLHAGPPTDGVTDLAVRLEQDMASGDLVISVRNPTSKRIVTPISDTVFEGTIWLIQKGSEPLQALSGDYFELLVKGLRASQWMPLDAGKEITYPIPMKSLVSPYGSRSLSADETVFVFVCIGRLESNCSNVIALENSGEIQIRNGLSTNLQP